jgi:hypothetical protein
LTILRAVDEPLAVGNLVVLSKELPGKHDRANHVGKVEHVRDDGMVGVRWEGPDAPDRLAWFDPRALECWAA